MPWHTATGRIPDFVTSTRPMNRVRIDCVLCVPMAEAVYFTCTGYFERPPCAPPKYFIVYIKPYFKNVRATRVRTTHRTSTRARGESLPLSLPLWPATKAFISIDGETLVSSCSTIYTVSLGQAVTCVRCDVPQTRRPLARRRPDEREVNA